MSSKSKSTLPETPTSKASPATPRVSRLTKGAAKSEPNSHSQQQNSRLSIDGSPKYVNPVHSKPAVDRRFPKVTTPPEKQQTRVVKGSEAQVQLNLAQEDLKEAKEKLDIVEKEKAKAVNELKEAQKLADEANEKLKEAVVAQKRAEKSSEIEKFRAVEMEQAGIEAALNKEDEWRIEVESVRNQHALDVAALLSTTQELQRVKQELAMTCDAKNHALSQADNATKIAEIHAEKVELLSAEVARLKASLNSKLETDANENNKMVSKLNSKIGSLKRELKMAKGLRDDLVEREASIEQLNVELEAARMGESYARNFVEEWKQRVEDLENQVEEARQLKTAVSESLNSVTKQLEAKNNSLHDAEAKITSLIEKVGLLEISIGRQKGEIVESECYLDVAKEEASTLAKIVESLKYDLETVKEEKAQALYNEKLVASTVETLLEEKNKLINKLENSRAEEGKSKKVMESLASALHEVSAEGRETKQKLICTQAEHESNATQLEDLKLVLKATNEKYEAMVDDAKHEIDQLMKTIEQTKNEFLNSKAEWEQKELYFVNCTKQSKEEKSSVGKEVDRLVNLLEEARAEASAAKDEGAEVKETLKEAESEVVFLRGVLAEAKAESMKLKEILWDKENELQSIVQENKDLGTRAATSLQKFEELSKLVEEKSAGKQCEGNGEITDSKKDYDMLPKEVEFSEEYGHGNEEIPNMELLPRPSEESQIENSHEKNDDVVNEEEFQKGTSTKFEEANGKPEEGESIGEKIGESCKIGEKDFSGESEHKHESFEEEMESKVDGGGGKSIGQINGSENIENCGRSSPTKMVQQQMKKKKPLLQKFGSLLKKKTPSNHK